jgi:CBS domain-containing protein
LYPTFPRWLFPVLPGLAARSDAPIRDLMALDPEGLCPTDPIAYALNRMMVRGFRNVPLMDEGKLVGVVCVRDILEYMTKEFSDVLKPASSS